MKQLTDYIKVFKNVIPESTCSEIINNNDKSNKWYTHEWARYGDADPSPSPETELLCLKTEIKKDYDILMESIWNALLLYHQQLNCSWYSSWNGYSPVRFNKYPEGSEMLGHCDHIHSMFDGIKKGIPVLSIVGLLNNDFEGGKFIMFDDYNVELSSGDILIFPSNFLYPHRVEKVLKGSRHSFVSWAY